MTMTNREEQIYKAADKATYQTPPQYSELVHKSRKVMCAYETGFIDGCVWADSHPQWIPVEDELPKEKGKYMFRLSNGDMCYETYYPKLKLLNNVTHWMPIIPPRKED